MYPYGETWPTLTREVALNASTIDLTGPRKNRRETERVYDARYRLIQFSHGSLLSPTANRAALWAFEKLDTLHNTLLHHAGRFTRPQRTFTFTLNAGALARQRLLNLLQALQHAA